MRKLRTDGSKDIRTIIYGVFISQALFMHDFQFQDNLMTQCYYHFTDGITEGQAGQVVGHTFWG